MTSWDAYPKVWNLGHAQLGELLWDDVVVQEKLDGSQFSFGRFGDQIRVRSRGREFDIEAPDGIFAAACTSVLRVRNHLLEGYTYRGEVLASPKHNVLSYSRTPKGHIVLFDVNKERQQDYMWGAAVQQEAHRLGLEPVPTIWSGQGSELTMQTLEQFLDRESVLGGTQIEGVVIKNYNRFDRNGKALMGKLVREEFKEKLRQSRPKSKNDMLAGIIEVYKTEARWHKATQHLRERGELTGEPKDIGPLLKELSTHLLEEEGEAIKEVLFKRYWKEIARGVGRGFAEWYKLELAKEQFKEKE